MEETARSRIESLEFRRALGRFASGITVITTEHEGAVHGMTANAFVSVSLDPPLVLVSVDNRAKMNEILPVSGHYGVSILRDSQEDLSQHFAGRPKEGTVVSFARRGGVPLLEGALAHLVCRLVDVHPAGDHTLYIGHVEYLDYGDGAPLLYYTGAYRCLEVQLWDHGYIW